MLSQFSRLIVLTFLITLPFKAEAWNLLNPLNSWIPPVQIWANVNMQGQNGIPNLANQAIQDAMNQWSVNGNANFTFQWGGETQDQNYSTRNSQTTIMTVANGAPGVNTGGGNFGCRVNANGGGIAGFAFSFSNNNQSTDGYIVICLNGMDPNGNLISNSWFVGVGSTSLPGATDVDFGSIVAHELGHIVRLAHSCDGTLNNGIVDCATLPANDTRVLATMNYLVNWGVMDNRTIEPDDMSGIQAIYGVFSPDLDEDGLTNAQEAQLGTNPNLKDTDGDGLTDGEEVHTYHTNPLSLDTDGDGIEDGKEVAIGLNPAQPDNPVIPIILSLLLEDGEGGEDGPFQLVEPLPEGVLDALTRHIGGRL